MRIFSLILIIISLASLILLPIFLVVFFQLGINDIINQLVKLIQATYLNVFPGILLIGLILRFHEYFTSKEKKLTVFDFVWYTILALSCSIFIFTYSSDETSFIRQVKNIISPETFSYAGELSPDLFSFLLWNSLFLVLISLLFVYRSLSRIGFDKAKVGGLLSSLAFAFMFGVFYEKIAIVQNLEEIFLDLRFSILRNPAKKEHSNNLRYCRAPYDVEGQKLTAIAPNPPGVREDIEIIGISNKTIEELKGNWPLDWQIYASLADRLSNSQNNILLYDISFLDEKGVYGGNYCGTKFTCNPIGKNVLRPQVDILSQSIANAKNTIVTDYPIETTDEARSSIVHYDERLALLRKTHKLKNISHGAYANPWNNYKSPLLPLPPVSKIQEAVDGIGFANVFKSEQGLNRWMPLVVRVWNKAKRGKPGYNPDIDDDFYPNIDLIIVSKYFGIDPVKDVEVNWLKGYLKLKNIPEKTYQKLNRETFEMETLDIMAKPNPSRTITIPIDKLGRMNINFRGGRFCFKFSEILEVSKMDPEQASQYYSNKIALVAMYYATGVGTAKDLHLSPYGDMAGIEHHAYALNTILNQDFAKETAPWMNLLILIVVAFIMGFYQPRIQTWLSFILAVAIAIVFTLITFYITFDIYSLYHVYTTVIAEQLFIFVSFIGLKVLTEEENVKFIRNTFSKFVSQDVVDELLANPEAIALGGARKEVSVFFSDVRGFTTISEKLTPEELVQLLNEYLSEMTELIIEYRGTIDKYMGDAIMAFWGAPAKNENHAYFACVAAVSQYRALQELQKRWSQRDIPVLDIGIGINTGPAVVGNMGSSRRMDYTLMGDTVNLGSRLEGITKQYGVKICISEFTYEKVKDRVYARELDLVRVKGKLEPVRIYELMGLKNDSDIINLKVSSPHNADS